MLDQKLREIEDKKAKLRKKYQVKKNITTFILYSFCLFLVGFTFVLYGYYSFTPTQKYVQPSLSEVTCENLEFHYEMCNRFDYPWNKRSCREGFLPKIMQCYVGSQIPSTTYQFLSI